MVYRALPLSLVALGLALFVSASVMADETNKVERGNVHKGTVVSVTADQLVIKGQARDGAEPKEWTYKLADNAKVMCDGHKCKIEDLKAGQKVRVTIKEGDSQTAVKIESLDKNGKFGSATVGADEAQRSERGFAHEGTVVSVTADQLVVKGQARDGASAHEQTYKLANHARVICDGKNCKIEDLKPGQKVRVTTSKGDKETAVRVESLDKNDKFEARANNRNGTK